MPPKPLVLLVAPPSPARRATVATLKALGLRVRTAREPYEGTARFVEHPSDLVVLSLAAFHRRDVAFLRAVRRRAPGCGVLLLVPEGQRLAARRALQAGADLWLPEPFYAEELQAFVRCLLPATAPGLGLRNPEASRAVRHLSREVAHAVNNPLQVLSMLAEEARPSKASKKASVEHVNRIRDAVPILEGFSRVGRPEHHEARLGPVVRDAVEGAVESGLVRLASAAPRDGALLSFDTTQIRYALDSLIGFLGALAPTHPLPIKVAVHRPPARRAFSPGRPGRRAPRPGRVVEAAFKGRGLRIEAARVERYASQVLCSHEETRAPHPGLAPVTLVAHNHAGRFVARDTPGGTVFGLVLPLS